MRRLSYDAIRCLQICLLAIIFSISGCKDREQERIRQRAVHIMLNSFADVASRLNNDCGHSQLTSSNFLAACVQNPGWPGWKGPYLDQIPQNPWGTAYKVTILDGHFRVESAGPDLTFGTSDDIANEEVLSGK
jgi:hypothetical protein